MRKIIVILVIMILVLTGCSSVKDTKEDVVSDIAIEDKTVSAKFKLGVLVNKVYDDAGYFKDGVCPVNIHGKWGVIDKQGEVIVKPQWDHMSLCSQDGYLMVANYLEEVDDGELIECGFIDIKGNTIVPLQKSFMPISMVYIIDAKYLGNDTFVINTDDRGFVYYNKNGKEIEPVKTKYKPELKYVQIRQKNGDEYQYGITSKDGNVIIEPQYSMAFSMGNGFFVVNEGGIERESMQGGTWKIINEKNETIMDLGEEGFYYVHDEPGYGWGESFPLYTPIGTLIIGGVNEENTEAQDLIDKYLNISKIEFESITASSTLQSQFNFNYEPKNVYDNNNLTAWVEGVPSNGEGQWIKFSRGTDSIIKTIFISNGYCKDNSTYNNNGRVKEIKLEFSDGTSQLVNLPDSMYEYVIINLPEKVKTSFVKCTIMTVYPGEKYSDTCINEIAFFGDNSINLETGSTQGSNRTQSNTTSNLDIINSKLNGDSKMYAEYYKILQERINQYGILPTYEYNGADCDMGLLHTSGVAYATLLDFDGDGTEKLFICYNSTESHYSEYIDASSPCMYEIWGYNGSSYLIAKEWATVFGGGNSLWGDLYVYKQDGNSYVVNYLTQKDVDEEGVFGYGHIIYGTVTNGKWVKNVFEQNSRNDIAMPWENLESIISFDELTYSDDDKAKLMDFLEELKNITNNHK